MIVFLSCTKKKRDYKCEAQEMYQESQWFKGGLRYAHSLNPDKVYILSAKYGLLEEEDIIEPYEKTLVSARDNEIRKWSAMVAKQISKKGIDRNQKAVFLCGKNYRKYIKNLFPNNTAPLKHLGIGKQMAFFKEHTK